MRPLHSLLVVVALAVLVAGGWWLLSTSDPAQRITAAGPAAGLPESGAAAAPEELRELDGELAQRRVESAVAPAAASAGQASASDSATLARALEGRVLDPEGNAVAGARVLLSEGSASFLAGTALDALGASRLFEVREQQSDGEGRFRFEGVEAAALRLAVRAPGFAPYDAADVPTPASSRLADIVLERGVRLAGRVVDAAGRPAADVRVLRSGPSVAGFVFGSGRTQVTKTAADGSFAVDVLAVGPWSLRFESDGHPDGQLSGRTERPGERVEGLLVQLDEGAAIRGRVTGQLSDGQSLEGLRVSASPRRDTPESRLESRSADVAADGSFAVLGARVGQRYVLRAVRPQQDFDGMPLEFLPGVSAAVEAEAGESGVVLVLSPECALSFTVVDAASGAALEDFTVDAGTDWRRPLNDESGRPLAHHPGGRVRVGDLRPRSSGERASVLVEAVGYLPYEADGLKLTPGVDTDLGTIALEPAPLLTVRVVDDTTGAPIAGADVLLARVDPPEVEPSGGVRRTIRASASVGGGGVDLANDLLEGETRAARTDEDGRARLTAFAGQDVRVRVRASRYAPWVGQVYRAAAVAEEREVRMTRGGTVVVHLFDAAGEPQAGGRVEHRPVLDGAAVPEFSSPTLTNEQGEARFEHLAAGRHRFRRATGESGGVFHSGASTFALRVSGDESESDDWVEVEVAEGGLHDVEIHLPLALAVHGRLTEGGEPLADAQLSLSEASESMSGMPDMAMFGGGGARATSDADGYWRFDEVEPGDYTLRISHAERAMPSEVSLTVLDTDLQRDVDLDVALLEGRVLDAAGEPLAGVEVWPERARPEGAPRVMRVMAFAGAGGGSLMTLDSGGSAARATTDADGRYVLRGVLADVELQVRGRGQGLQPGRSEPVRVAVDQRRTGVDLTLQAAGWIEVQGVFADGSPAANLLVTARYEGELEGVEPQTILLDPTGKGRLDGLAPGSWRLTARTIGPGSEEPPPAELVVGVSAGAATPATLTAP